jgi:hypothetical protein
MSGTGRAKVKDATVYYCSAEGNNGGIDDGFHLDSDSCNVSFDHYCLCGTTAAIDSNMYAEYPAGCFRMNDVCIPSCGDLDGEPSYTNDFSNQSLILYLISSDGACSGSTIVDNDIPESECSAMFPSTGLGIIACLCCFRDRSSAFLSISVDTDHHVFVPRCILFNEFPTLDVNVNMGDNRIDDSSAMPNQHHLNTGAGPEFTPILQTETLSGSEQFPPSSASTKFFYFSEDSIAEDWGAMWILRSESATLNSSAKLVSSSNGSVYGDLIWSPSWQSPQSDWRNLLGVGSTGLMMIRFGMSV